MNCNDAWLNTKGDDISDSYVKYADYQELAVQLANAESKGRELAAENAYLLPKAASELSNAWVLHKYLIGIQSAIMYLDGGNKKAAQEWLYGTISGPGFEFPDEVEVGDDIDAWATHQMRDSISYPRAVEIIKAETPATDAFLAEVRASALEYYANLFKDTVNMDLKHNQEFHKGTLYVADQFRKGVQS
ncbi:hypothetical protein ACKU2B_022270 [Citrobacter freundii]